MRYLSKLTAVALATLALIAPATAQADPGINVNLSDGGFQFTGITTCTWENVPTNGNPPATVIVSASAVNNVISCTNSYWGVVNADFAVDFDAAGTATVQMVDVAVGALFFWCRYRAENVVLNPDPIGIYQGNFNARLHDSNWSSQCPNPVSVRIWFRFY